MSVAEEASIALYTFDSPRELIATQLWLDKNVTEDVYKELTIDNALRAVNTYQKFEYDSSSTVVRKAGKGFCVYSLRSEHIDYSDLFLMLCEVNPITLRIREVNEYKMLNAMSSEVS